MMHVLCITPQFPACARAEVGGLFTHTRELVAGLEAAGCRCTVLVPRLDGPSAVEGAVHRVRPSDRVLRMPLAPDGDPAVEQLALFAEELRAYAVDLPVRPDVVHVHDFWLAPVAFGLRERWGAPVVLSLHLVHSPLRAFWGDYIDPRVDRLERAACRDADAVIAVSASLAALVRDGASVPAARVHVVHNGFDGRAFAAAAGEAAAARREFGFGGEPVVVFAGRLSLQKGVAPLLRSALAVTRARPEVRYAVAGVRLEREGLGPERRQMVDEIEALLDEPGLAARVCLLGELSRDRLARLYAASSIAVVPSVYEPFGYAAVEPMAVGVPVVATRTGGLPEIIDDGETGLLVPVCRDALPHSPDVGALAEAQLRLLGDPALARRLADRGRERVLAAFSCEAMVGETLAVYAAVRGGSARAAGRGGAE